MLPRITHRLDFPRHSTVPESSRNQNSADPFEQLVVRFPVQLLRLHRTEAHLHRIRNPRVRKRLVDALVRIPQSNVLPDHRNFHTSVPRVKHRLQHLFPLGQIALPLRKIQEPENAGVNPLTGEIQRHFINRIFHVQLFNHVLPLHIAEQGQFLLVILLHRDFAAADQNVRNNSNPAQNPHRLLRRLGLQLPRRLDERNQRQMDEQGIVLPELVIKLADRFKKRQRFNIARRSPDLGNGNIHILRVHRGNRRFDLVGDMRNDLNRPSEIAPFAFPVDHRTVNPAGRIIARLGAVDACESFIVPEIQIGLRSVIGHINLSVLIR